jgi:predicted TIM-barrel fold metal-dependent hydrolase
MTAPATSAAKKGLSTQKQAIIDCDVHNQLESERSLYPFLAQRWRDYIDSFGNRRYTGAGYPTIGRSRFDLTLPAGQTVPNAATTAADHLDRHGITYAILIPVTQVGLIQYQELDAALASGVNEWQIAEWLDLEPRFRASIAIPYDSPDLAVEEIQRRAADKRFVQVKFNSSAAEPLGRRKYWPIYEACVSNRLAVMMHAFGYAGHPASAAGWPASIFTEHAGAAEVVQANIISMIAEGVFENFPTLQVVSVENSFAWLAALAWRLDRSWTLLKHEVPHLKRLPSEYLEDHLYLATQPMDSPEPPHDLRQLFEHYPSFVNQLVFSSDYPHWDTDSPDNVLPPLLSDDIRRRIYSENARRLYNLP